MTTKTPTIPRAMTPKEVKRLNAEVPELWGATQVAAEVGVQQQNLSKLANLPAPIEMLRGKVWRADVIRAYAAARHFRLEVEKAERGDEDDG